MAGEYSEKMLNHPELLKREILSQQKYWFSKSSYGLFAGIFALAILGGIYVGTIGFLAGVFLLIVVWKSCTSFKKNIKSCKWEIKTALLQPKSKRQKKGMAYTDAMQRDELVYTDFRYPDGKVLSGNCRIGDFTEGMEFYTVIVSGKKIVYSWPTFR